MVTYTNREIDDIRAEFTDDYNVAVKAAREYDAGRHTRMITARQQHQLFGKPMQPMADNVVKLVLTTAASRLTFEEWAVKEAEVDDGETTDNDEDGAGPVKTYLDDLYMRNQLRRKQYDVHRATLRDGDHAVALAFRKGRVHIVRERWWDGESGVFVAYDRDDEEEFAVREWEERVPGQDRPRRRRNVYYPDHFQRFYKDGSGWQPITDRDPDTPNAEMFKDGTVRWEKGPNDPLGIPIVHFANGSRDDTLYGESDIYEMLGLQDELNSIQHDMAAAAKYTGFQMYWTKNAKGDKRLTIGPGMLFEFDHPNAEMHALKAGDMSALEASHAYKRKTMTINSETPLPTIEGADFPSGESLFQIYTPLVNKVTRLGAIAGPGWVKVGHRATEMANTFQRLNLDEDAPISAIFADPRQPDDLTIARAQVEKARVMEVVSRIQDLTLIEQLDFIDADTLERLRAERNGEGVPDERVLAEF